MYRQVYEFNGGAKRVKKIIIIIITLTTKLNKWKKNSNENCLAINIYLYNRMKFYLGFKNNPNQIGSIVDKKKKKGYNIICRTHGEVREIIIKK